MNQFHARAVWGKTGFLWVTYVVSTLEKSLRRLQNPPSTPLSGIFEPAFPAMRIGTGDCPQYWAIARATFDIHPDSNGARLTVTHDELGANQV